MQVIDGGELDINFIVETPSGRLVVPDIKKTGDLHKLAALYYHFCTITFFCLRCKCAYVRCIKTLK